MKILITQDTFVPSIDGPTHLPANSLADIEADSAHAVVRAGKGLYVETKDDPTRNKQFTATESRIELVKKATAAAKKSAKAEETPPPAA